MARLHAVVVAVLTLVAHSSAQPPLEPPKPPEPDLQVPQWTVEFRPSAWYVAPGGKLRLPGLTSSPSDVQASDISLDKPRLSPLAELHVFQGPWRFSVGGFAYAIDEEEPALFGGQLGDVTYSAGDVIRDHLDVFCVEGTAGYRFVEEAMNPAHGVYAMVFSLDAVGGVRAYDTSVMVERPGISSSSAHEFFIEPIVGVKVNAEMYRGFSVELQSEIGFQPVGDRTVWSWDIILGGSWRPFENLGVRLGFRQLLFDLQSGSDEEEFRFRGGMAGLFAGIEVRF